MKSAVLAAGALLVLLLSGCAQGSGTNDGKRVGTDPTLSAQPTISSTISADEAVSAAAGLKPLPAPTEQAMRSTPRKIATPTAGQLASGAFSAVGPSQLWCGTGEIGERTTGISLQQFTHYCVTGTSVYSVGQPLLNGYFTGKSNYPISWSGEDSTSLQCYQRGTVSRYYCVQITFGHFNQAGGRGFTLPEFNGFGGGGYSIDVDNRYNVWTEVAVYANGYAACANSHDAKWVQCWHYTG